jgi:flagellin-like protein
MNKMSIKKFLNSKKGISPILATLLLIVIAVAAIVVTYAWITTYMSSATSQAGVILYKENIRFDQDESKTILTIGNSGTEDTRIVRVWLGNSSTTMMDVTSDVDEIVGAGAALNGGNIVELTISWPNDVANNWEPGENYYFRIVPNPGQFIEIQEQAPQ